MLVQPLQPPQFALFNEIKYFSNLDKDKDKDCLVQTEVQSSSYEKSKQLSERLVGGVKGLAHLYSSDDQSIIIISHQSVRIKHGHLKETKKKPTHR